jgi:hypothetical protein
MMEGYFMDGEIICFETWKREKEEQQLEELASLQDELTEIVNKIPIESSDIHMLTDITMPPIIAPYSSWTTGYGMSLDDVYSYSISSDKCPSCGHPREDEE